MDKSLQAIHADVVSLDRDDTFDLQTVLESFFNLRLTKGRKSY